MKHFEVECQTRNLHRSRSARANNFRNSTKYIQIKKCWQVDIGVDREGKKSCKIYYWMEWNDFGERASDSALMMLCLRIWIWQPQGRFQLNSCAVNHCIYNLLNIISSCTCYYLLMKIVDRTYWNAHAPSGCQRWLFGALNPGEGERPNTKSTWTKKEIVS